MSEKHLPCGREDEARKGLMSIDELEDSGLTDVKEEEEEGTGVGYRLGFEGVIDASLPKYDGICGL